MRINTVPTIPIATPIPMAVGVESERSSSGYRVAGDVVRT
jgi:hypothetical protein